MGSLGNPPIQIFDKLSHESAQSLKILPNILDFVGNTPMVRLNRIPQSFGIKCEILAKCELFSPGGSHKDRVSREMINVAESDGSLLPGQMIVYPTSGNSGISASVVAAVKGYKMIVIVPDKCSTEKVRIIRSLGSQVIRCSEGEDNVSVARRIHKTKLNSVLLNQYDNIQNVKVHAEVTGREILEQCSGQVDMIVAAVGSAGSLMGLSQKMKSDANSRSCIVVGVDSEDKPLDCDTDGDNVEKDKSPKQWLLEIGHPSQVPPLLDYSKVDKWLKCSDVNAYVMTRRIIQEEGILVGPTSGAVLSAAIEAIREFDLKEGQRCVIMFSDGVRNYMNTLMSNAWMREKQFFTKEEELINNESESE